MNTAFDILAGIFLVIGCLMSLGAAIGIARFPDVLSRLHPGAKPQVFGLFMLVIGICCAARNWAVVPLLGLIWLLQLLAAPVSAHMVGRSGFRNKHFQPEFLTHNELADLVEQMNKEEETEGIQPGRATQSDARPASEESLGDHDNAGSQPRAY